MDDLDREATIITVVGFGLMSSLFAWTLLGWPGGYADWGFVWLN